MPKTISAEDIDVKLRQIEEKIERLQEDKDILLKAKEVLFPPPLTISLKPRARSVDDILRSEFEAAPAKRFTEDDIAGILAIKRRDGVFVAAARNLRSYARPVLRRLEELGEIQVGGSTESPWWQKSKNT